MEERDKKNFMCSVLFLDIVEYSKQTVAVQISLKERFNSYLSTAIQDIPVANRLILDTGDGAAINFLDDIEDALKVAISFRKSLLNEDPSLEPSLLVRMGINLGPVKLVQDINGQWNVVGDGINVAQRVMAFADAGQILVSRTYYDAVTWLSQTYVGMFHYQGSRTDKHVREHEIYAIGFPGDQTNKQAQVKSGATIYRRFRQMAMQRRVLYLGAVILFLGLAGMFMHIETTPGNVTSVTAASAPVASIVPIIAPVSAPPKAPALAPVLPKAPTPPLESSKVPSKAPPKAPAKAPIKELKVPTKTPGKTQSISPVTVPRAHDSEEAPVPKPEMHVKRKSEKSGMPVKPQVTTSTVDVNAEAYVSLVCHEGAQIFIDGMIKGTVIKTGLIVAVRPGWHKINVISKNKSQEDKMFCAPGQTLQVSRDFCKP